LCYHATTVIAEAEKSRRLMRLGRQKEKKKTQQPAGTNPRTKPANIVELQRCTARKKKMSTRSWLTAHNFTICQPKDDKACVSITGQ
jgi:hypothetical protein